MLTSSCLCVSTGRNLCLPDVPELRLPLRRAIPLPKQHSTTHSHSFAFALTILFVRLQLQKGLRPRRSVRTAMAKEINMYATVQKDEMGLDKAVEDVKYMMSRYSVT